MSTGGETEGTMAGTCGDKLALEQRVLASAKRQGAGMNRQASISVLAEVSPGMPAVQKPDTGGLLRAWPPGLARHEEP